MVIRTSYISKGEEWAPIFSDQASRLARGLTTPAPGQQVTRTCPDCGSQHTIEHNEGDLLRCRPCRLRIGPHKPKPFVDNTWRPLPSFF